MTEPTKRQWLDAIDKSLEMWSKRTAGAYSRPEFHECAICALAGTCFHCVAYEIYGCRCDDPEAPVSAYITGHKKDDAAWAVLSLCLLRAIIEEEM